MSPDDHFAQLPGGVEICYRIDGDPSDPPIVLIAGLGLDLTSWPRQLVEGLCAEGFFVVRLDNRDSGRSTRIATRAPGLLRKLLARPRADAYDLGEMTADTARLLDTMGLHSVHVVGMSMGGMIGQTLAARYPRRVRSLTSIFSTTGAAGIGQPARTTILRMGKPPARTLDDHVTRHLAMLGHLASTTYPPDETDEVTYAHSVWTRGAGPTNHEGVSRQISAIQKSGDRTSELRAISAPTLVLHGDQDLMVSATGGAATADAVPGSQHLTIPGMRHHLAPQLAPQLVRLIAAHAADAPAITPSRTGAKP